MNLGTISNSNYRRDIPNFVTTDSGWLELLGFGWNGLGETRQANKII